MSIHNLCQGLTVKTVKKDQKYHIGGLYIKNAKIYDQWEHIAAVSLICTNFVQKDHPKNVIYAIGGGMRFQHVERNKVHYLKIEVLSNDLYLDTIEVKLISAILNRVIARTDILARNDYIEESYDEMMGLNIFSELPISIERLEVENDDFFDL